jgi:hypothetical protein
LILHGPHRKPKNWGGGTETARWSREPPEKK